MSPGPVVQCRRCGLVYVSPRENEQALISEGPVLSDASTHLLTSRNLADLGDCWELMLLPGRLRERDALRANAKDALGKISRFRKPPGALLDFGCGWGFFLAEAKTFGWEPWGLEPLAGHAVYARGELGLQVVTDTLRETTFLPEQFDVVTAFQVFEHLPDPSSDLRKLARFLKPGGVVYIEVPNIDTWGVRLLKNRHRHFVRDHLYFFSPVTLTRLMRNAGLEVVGIRKPTRWMSLRHLIADWGGKYVSRELAMTVDKVLERTGLGRFIVPVNLGDIVAVMGRKP